MSKKSIMIGCDGKITLKKEMLRHLKVKPGEELSYKLLPGNKVILALSNDQQNSNNKDTKPPNLFELSDLEYTAIDIYNTYDKSDKQLSLH
ncbi:Uncharacterised protein [Oligella ureolytica]|uniref:SpoVT-AbrB domain-containing protein n=1 Tax=Oligella ureolytica TaxID=90244 RepID=A0A378XGY8_9BURK|nr:hypothetical protein [Oligella ureolytica]QPT41067.1 hypothetical protein I6G29_05885 [Oligella ureolytica]SUA53605.1 Uncharacterised protein [Oligella ureolytica]SUA53731.1 Uncharacterised protein [Oligella ureolytica]